MKIPFLSSYLSDFETCRKVTLSRGVIWSAWGKFFFAVGWWTSFALKGLFLPVYAILFMLFVIGQGANWILYRLAELAAFPRSRAREKHVLGN